MIYLSLLNLFMVYIHCLVFRNPSLLVDIYKTVYQASTNDLHSEVRRTGMLFWHRLIQEIPDDEKNNKRSIIKIFENLSSVGCLQVN